MNKDELRRCLRRELDIWSAKPYEALRTKLRDAVHYSVGEGPEWCQVEVMLLESKAEYVHTTVMIDDGGWRAFVPLSTSFLTHRDGRVDKSEV